MCGFRRSYTVELEPPPRRHNSAASGSRARSPPQTSSGAGRHNEAWSQSQQHSVAGPPVSNRFSSLGPLAAYTGDGRPLEHLR